MKHLKKQTSFHQDTAYSITKFGNMLSLQSYPLAAANYEAMENLINKIDKSIEEIMKFGYKNVSGMKINK